VARSKLSDLNTLLNTLVIGIVAYFALKAMRGAQTVIDSVTQPAAEAWVRLTSGPRVTILGRVALPDGRLIPIQDILDAGGSVDSRGFFRWQGTTYQITGRNNAGDYSASRIIT
jgi:hypothetical protein